MLQLLLSYLFPQTIDKVHSKFNGEIKVQLFSGRVSISAGGLMQSGKFLEDTWYKAFKKFEIRNSKFEIPRILILGLGAGSIVHVLNKTFPNTEIIGIDIDQKIVSLGEKYNDLGKIKNLKIVIDDATKYLTTQKKNREKYSLIFVDLYRGFAIPPKFQTTSFLTQLDQILETRGIIVFNRLKAQMQKDEAKSFLDKVGKIFQSVVSVTVFANTLVCARHKTARPLKVT